MKLLERTHQLKSEMVFYEIIHIVLLKDCFSFACCGF